MKRRDAVPGIPPFVDFYGRPTFENPAGQNRPNPALTEPAPAAVIAEPQAIRAVAPPQAVEAQDLASVGTRTSRSSQPLTRTRAWKQSRIARVAGVAVAIATTFVGMTAASAYFTSGGSGSGNASTGTISVTVAATTGTPTTPLYPGGSGDVTLRVTNPNTFDVTLKSVTRTGPIAPDSPGHAGCSPTGVTFDDQNGLSVNLPAGNTTLVDLTNAAHMDTTSVNACQGATFTIPVSVTVRNP